MKRDAFTLIELLVVVTIIVVLLALLTPALDKAMESGMRAKCAANLHAFGSAVNQYIMDSKRKLPLPVQAYGGPYPSLIRHINSQGPGQWSAELIGPYLGGVDLKQGYYGDQWYCPSNGKTAKKVAQNKETATGLLSPLGGNYAWVALDYAYFARVAAENTTFPDQLAGNSTLVSGKLLMADTLYYWQGGNHQNWWFNHHREGPSVHDAPWGGPNMTGDAIKGISGTNQLFGDGAVIWKDGSQFKPDLMLGYSFEVGWVSPGKGAPGQPKWDHDLNFF
jgi:prepilin-type N-terminal cleavage/methylation domain-containing protein